MPAPAFISLAEAHSPTLQANLACNRPSGLSGGERLVALVSTGRQVAFGVTPPAGWDVLIAEVHLDNDAGASGSTGVFAAYTRQLPADLTGEPASYTFTVSNDIGNIAIAIYAFEASTVNVVGGLTYTGTNIRTYVGSSITTTAADTRLLLITASDRQLLDATVITPGADVALLGSHGSYSADWSVSSTGNCSHMVLHGTQASAGATGSREVSVSVDTAASFAVAGLVALEASAATGPTHPFTSVTIS